MKQCPYARKTSPLLTPFAALALLAGCASEGETKDNTEPAAATPGAGTEQVQADEPAPPPAIEPAQKELAARITELGSEFGGRVGIAVQDVESGWSTGYNEDEMLPQQSVSKLWVALTALDKAQKGEFDLSKQITLTREDLTLFHQPVRDLILRYGSYTVAARELLRRAITKSDNTANDVLLWQVGGPDQVRETLAAKGFVGIRFGPGERRMQSAIAGLEWSPAYSLENEFYDARDRVPDSVRRIAFESYLSNPVDGASARAIADALAQLAAGELLPPGATRRFIEILKVTSSGPRRLKGGRPEGWEVAHKTGTGQFYDGRQSGYNDVGLLIAPDGTTYSIAVLIGETRKPTLERMEMMQEVTRAVAGYHREKEELLSQEEEDKPEERKAHG